jgi:CHASE3 domain sensor protein
MSIHVVRAFVQLRELLSSNKELAKRLDQLEARIEKKLTFHDPQPRILQRPGVEV